MLYETKISLNFPYFLKYPFLVVGWLSYAARDDLGSIEDPDPIKGNKLDSENKIKLVKMATEEFINYRRIYSGDIIFNEDDFDDYSKALKT